MAGDARRGSRRAEHLDDERSCVKRLTDGVSKARDAREHGRPRSRLPHPLEEHAGTEKQRSRERERTKSVPDREAREWLSRPQKRRRKTKGTEQQRGPKPGEGRAAGDRARRPEAHGSEDQHGSHGESQQCREQDDGALGQTPSRRKCQCEPGRGPETGRTASTRLPTTGCIPAGGVVRGATTAEQPGRR